MSRTLETEAEELRRKAQRALDSAANATKRNKMGQVATPTNLAIQMAELSKTYLPAEIPVRFLDPALGTGVFFYAASMVFGGRIETAHGYEIDKLVANIAREIWGSFGLTVHTADFCIAAAPDKEDQKPNLIICNPPYVRHHHLSGERKALLKARLTGEGYCLNGLAGLYCYFLLIADRWLSKNAISNWIVPAEFLDVNYGRWLKQYLTSKVTLLRLHRFEPHDLQFQDALVSSVILTFRADKPPAKHEVTLSGGGTLLQPRFRGCVKNDNLVASLKWGPLFDGAHNQIVVPVADKFQSSISIGDLFVVKRGIATGANDFFILTREQAAELKLPLRYLRPILPSPRKIASSVVETSGNGFPRGLPELVLIDCDLPLEQIRTEEPELFAYLQFGKEERIDEGYLTTHRGRWYRQESRPPAPIVCTYMARQRNGRGLRFIRNKSSATALNVYLLLYPKANLASMMESDSSIIERVFEALCQAATRLIPGGRVYGGGLRKIEPRELASIRLPQWLTDEYPSLIQFRLERETATN